jgi:AraC-like DNA-binding protein
MTPATKRVPARYLSALLDELRTQGADTAAILRAARIEPESFERQDARLLPVELDALIAAARRITGRTDLGFMTGTLIKMNSHDILGYGMLSCRDFDQVMRLVSRYYHLMNELFTLRYQRTGDIGVALYSPVAAMPQEMLHFLMETIAVAQHHQMKQILGPALEPYGIQMAMPKPTHHARYLALAPARFQFDDQAMPGVRVVMGAELLSHPLPLASEKVVQQVADRCEALSRRPTPEAGGWGTFVTMMLTEANGEQFTLEDLGRRLNVSARTIDRHLKKEGLQYRDIAQRVYVARAREMLDQPGITVAQIADRLGFSDAANFSRAFKRFTGSSPLQYQRAGADLRATQRHEPTLEIGTAPQSTPGEET